jgi:hypothetical protein
MASKLFNIKEYENRNDLLREQKRDRIISQFPLKPIYDDCVFAIKWAIDRTCSAPTAIVDITDMDRAMGYGFFDDKAMDFRPFLNNMLVELKRMLEDGSPSTEVDLKIERHGRYEVTDKYYTNLRITWK